MLNKRNVILIILLLIVLGAGVFFLCRYNFKENEKEKIEEREHKKIDDDIYGFMLVNYGDWESDNYSLVELHKNGEDKTIAYMGNKGVSNFNIMHNRIYYKVSDGVNSTLMYIDLNDDSYEQIKVADVDNVGYYYDFTDDYVFTSMGVYGLARIDLKTGERVVYDKEQSFHTFIYRDRVYNLNYDDEGEKYYTLDFNGENLEWISEEDYNEALNKIDERDWLDGVQRFIKNNKIISSSNDATKLLIDNEVVYETKNEITMELVYINDVNKVLISEQKCSAYECEDEKNLVLDLKTKNVSETSDDFPYLCYIIYVQ